MRETEAAQRPTSFHGILDLIKRTVVASGRGKVENLLLVSHFSMAAERVGGNVGIARLLRDFQGTVGRVGKLSLLFHSFHGPGISTALSVPACRFYGPARGDSILHRRNNCIFAAANFRAHSVSLILRAIWSNCAKFTFSFRCCPASISPFSLSYGVA